MAKKKKKQYKVKKGGKKGKKGSKKAKRKAQGRKLVRYNKLAKQIGKKAARAQIYGGKKPKKGGHKGKKGKKGRKGGAGRKAKAKINYCTRGKCSRRPIFGGAKGMATHNRRHH